MRLEKDTALVTGASSGIGAGGELPFPPRGRAAAADRS